MRPPRIVFTGITGLLGGYFFKKKDLRFDIFGVSRRDFDIVERTKVIDFIKNINPKIIVHAASLGNVDYCEEHPEEAYKVNVEGTQNIISAAKKVNARIIFLSSNAIFDGDNPPYDEGSIANPIDIYGKTKVEGEKLIKESNLKFCILRLMTMYGWPQKGGRSNPVSWIIENLKEGRRLKVVDDVYNNHLWAGQAAEVLWKVIKNGFENEMLNIAGGESVSRFDLAKKVARIFKLNSALLNSVTSDFFNSIAKRPKNTTFTTKKMEKKLEIKPLTIDEGLRLMKQERNNSINQR